MSTKENEAIVEQFYDGLFIKGRTNLVAIDRQLADDFVGHNLPTGLAGREGLKRFVGMFAASFSNTMQIKTHDVISKEDKVVVRWSSMGTHTGEFMGIPATGKQIKVKGIDIFRLAEGKITDIWQEMDVLGILQQMSTPTQVP